MTSNRSNLNKITAEALGFNVIESWTARSTSMAVRESVGGPVIEWNPMADSYQRDLLQKRFGLTLQFWNDGRDNPWSSSFLHENGTKHIQDSYSPGEAVCKCVKELWTIKREDIMMTDTELVHGHPICALCDQPSFWVNRCIECRHDFCGECYKDHNHCGYCKAGRRMFTLASVVEGKKIICGPCSGLGFYKPDNRSGVHE